MTDIKKLKVVLIKSVCQKIGGKCDDRRLIKSLSVRVHSSTLTILELGIDEPLLIEIWEPLKLKKKSFNQEKIFYKDAVLAVVGAGKNFGNHGICRNLTNKTDEAAFQLGESNVIVLSDVSMGDIRARTGYCSGMTSHTGENGKELLEQIRSSIRKISSTVLLTIVKNTFLKKCIYINRI